MLQDVARNLVYLFPSFGRLHMMRSWGGVMDMSMDGAPIVGKTPLDNLYISTGWCIGGFKAVPAGGFSPAYNHRARTAGTRSTPRSRWTASRAGMSSTRRGRAHSRICNDLAMLLIPCPWCGKRAHVEFTYGGAAASLPPRDAAALDETAWAAHLYL